MGVLSIAVSIIKVIAFPRIAFCSVLYFLARIVEAEGLHA